MANCNDLLNINDDCDNIYGSFVKIAFAPKDFMTDFNVDNGVIDLLDLEDINVSPFEPYSPVEFYVKQNKISYEIGSEIAFDNNTTVFNNTFTVHLVGQTVEQRNAIMSLTQGQREVLVFALSDTGLWYVIGATDGVDGRIGARVSEVSGEVGLMRSDVNEFVLNIGTQEDKELHYYLDPILADNIFS